MKTKDYRLHKFLLKHGAVRKFKANLERNGDMTYQDRLERGEVHKPVIMGSLYWLGSPEGITYWDNLNEKYQDEFPSS